MRTAALLRWQQAFLDGIREQDATGLFEQRNGASAESRFGVYLEGIWIRIRDSLAEDFYLTRKLLGSVKFEQMIRNFLSEKRERELELFELSTEFAKFFSVDSHPALSRAIRLDILALEARRAPEPEVVLEFPSFGLHPSARFLDSGHRFYVLWRFDGSVRRERIDEKLRKFLTCFQKPQSFERLTSKLEDLGESPDYVQRQVSSWVSVGLIVNFPS